MKPHAAYDTISRWYDSFIQNGSPADDILIPHLLLLAGDVAGLSVLDLACGQGRLSIALADLGAKVTGVDVSVNLLNLAKRESEKRSLSVCYVEDDAQILSSVEANAFDGVFCHMSLMDIPDLGAVFRAVRRVLAPEGWFVYSLTHPCFQTPHSQWVETESGQLAKQVNGYFEEGFWKSEYPHGVRGKVGAHHRMLSTYLNGLAENGLVLQRIVEPKPTEKTAREVPGYAEAPPFVAIHSIKME